MSSKPTLNRKNIRALLKGEKITEKGVIAEKLADGVEGDVRYSINIMVDGKRHHRIIGRSSDGVTLTQAHEALQLLRTRAREGRLDLPKGRKTYVGFKEAAADYLIRLEETGGKNLVPKRRHLGSYLLDFFASFRLDQITDFAVHQYQAKRSKDGAAAGTINRELATLRHLLNSAARWKWIPKDSVPFFTLVSEPQQPMAILDDRQAQALLQAAQKDQDDRCWLFVAFGLGAAMRHREILKVRFEHVDFINRRIYIPDAKAGQREQPITHSLVLALKAQRAKLPEKERAGWVFPTLIPKQSKDGHRTNMARAFARSVMRAGLDPAKVTPHTMRRTAITRLVKAGIDLPTIQRISGHKTLAMVLRYVNIHGSHIDRAISVLDDAGSQITQELHREEIAA